MSAGRGTATVLAFGDVWDQYHDLLVQDAPVLIRGQVSGRDRDEDDPPIFLDSVVPLAQLRDRTRALAKVLLEKNQTVLRGAKLAMKRTKYMDWDVSADYLYAKMAEALHFGAKENRENAMKAFLDDKTFKPGLEHFKGTK